MNNKIEFEESTGNVFTDLGLENAEELQTRSLVGFHVVELLKKRICSALPADGARRAMARINAQISVKGEKF